MSPIYQPGGEPVIDAGQAGYFISNGILHTPTGTGNINPTTVGGVNVVNLLGFMFPMSMIIRNVMVQKSVAVAGSHCGVGIYDSSGTLQIDSTPILLTATGIFQQTLTNPYIIKPGQYWFAWTGDNATGGSVIASTLSNVAATLTMFGNLGPTTIIARASNASVGGQLPATTGIVNAANGPYATAIPYVIFRS